MPHMRVPSIVDAMLQPFARHLWLVLGATLAVAFVLIASGPYATSWHFFNDAAHGLLAPSGAPDALGLDLYRTHPEFQFGPVAVVIAAPFAFLPQSIGVPAVVVFTSLLGVAALVALGDAARRARPDADPRRLRRNLLLGGVALTLVWTDISIGAVHLDDAVALAATAGALAATARGKPWLATGALALAAAAKPWAIVFAPLALVLPGRFRVARVAAIGAAVALTWLPFVIDAPNTIAAARSFTIQNAPSSALRALGITDPSTPSWVRPAQIVLGLAIATALVHRRRWPGIVMAGLALRLMLDPGVHHYYAAGLTLGVLAWELLRRPDRLPWVTMVTAVVLELTSDVLQPFSLAGWLRLGLTGALIGAAALAYSTRTRSRNAPLARDARVRFGAPEPEPTARNDGEGVLRV
jgi:hypothetical protein